MAVQDGFVKLFVMWGVVLAPMMYGTDCFCVRIAGCVGASEWQKAALTNWFGSKLQPGV